MAEPRRCTLTTAVGILAISLLPCTNAGAAGPEFLPGQQTGNMNLTAIYEASGIAASRLNPGVLWVHNDSGDSARVFALNTQGTHLRTFNISGAGATDWEDMAVGPGPAAGTSYLYLGDIGDNSAVRGSITVYRVPEPPVSATPSQPTTSLTGTDSITLQYPDAPRDAETLMVDTNGDIYLVSKREAKSRVYRAAFPQSTTTTVTMAYLGELAWGWATAGDISPSGKEVLVRGYAGSALGARLWTRPGGGTVWDALSSTAWSVPLASDPQGEAICFGADEAGYYTVSEGSGQPIYYYERIAEPAALPLLALGGAALLRRKRRRERHY